MGDRVLQSAGQRLMDLAPTGATIARFGGDEFIVACTLGGIREVEQLADELFRSITAPILLEANGTNPKNPSDSSAHHIEIGCSVGISLMPRDGADIDSILQAADLALYNAKLNGRNQVVFYESAMSRELTQRREIESELRLAMQREELSLFFQPIIDLQTGRIRSLEALVRWFHPTKGELTPDRFIPVAEETGIIIALGNWITAHAARVAANWPDEVTLAVNLSPLQIRAPGAAHGILAALRKAGFPPQRLELEITESVLLDCSPATDAFIDELGAAGVRFALDDFGTGYSSLSYLSKYNFSLIKIDRSFVSGKNAGQRSDAIIRAVSEMATTLGMDLVAEGIETVDQAGAMAALGCSMGQGYYFSRAVPDYVVATLLAREREVLPQLRLVI